MSGPIWVFEPSPLSPEERRIEDARHGEDEARWFHALRPWQQSMEVVRRVAVGVYSVGFLHAGNFAYLALIALFAFFIVVAALAGAAGQTAFGTEAIAGFFSTVPPNVADALRAPVESAMTARSGPVLWFSAAVSLWTVGSLIESIRAIQHAAYGTDFTKPFWHYRLGAVLLIMLAVVVMMMAFSAQVLLRGVEEFVAAYLPRLDIAGTIVLASRYVPFLLLFATLYLIFHRTSPHQYRGPHCPKWPGAALVSLWWLGATALLPVFLRIVGGYDQIYGSLAGAVIALIFFYGIGLGMVTGAQLNAALVNAGHGTDS